MILELYPWIFIVKLAGGDVETQDGMGKVSCDEEFFDLVLEMLGDAAATCPQFGKNLGLTCITEAVQDNSPDLWWQGQRTRCDLFCRHWMVMGL